MANIGPPLWGQETESQHCGHRPGLLRAEIVVDEGCLTLLRLQDTAEFVSEAMLTGHPKPALQEAHIIYIHHLLEGK